MGDIYHAGEVYAGSVPIDDTQASEETVYSSAKVETMVEEVQGKLDGKAEWLYKIATISTIHLESSSDMFVFATTNNYVGVFHASGNGTISKIDLSPASSLTINISNANQVTFSSTSPVVVNAICKAGKAWVV